MSHVMIEVNEKQRKRILEITGEDVKRYLETLLQLTIEGKLDPWTIHENCEHTPNEETLQAMAEVDEMISNNSGKSQTVKDFFTEIRKEC